MKERNIKEQHIEKKKYKKKQKQLGCLLDDEPFVDTKFKRVEKKCYGLLLPFSSKIGTPPKTVAKQHQRKATVINKTAT